MRNRSFFVLVSIVSLVLVTAVACSGGGRDADAEVAIAVALTQTAAAAGQSQPAPAATATIAPTATAEAQGGLQPLDSAACSELADAVAQALGVAAMTAEAPFEDRVSGQAGTGCQVTATGTGHNFENLGVVDTALREMLQARGWQEDVQYAGGGACGLLTGFRQADRLCLLLATCGPSEDELCSSDEALVACWERLTPEQRLYTARLNCARGVPSEAPQATQPAIVALEDGAQCAFAGTGATLAFEGKRLNYTCAVAGEDQVGLLGDLQPSGEVWVAEKAVIGHNESGFFVKESEMVTVHTIQQPEVKRIEFAPGAISAQVQGKLAAGQVDQYVIRALAGQTMSVDILPAQAGAPNAILVIWGADGTVLISDHADATTWTGPLPTTQDYFIDVISVAQVAVDYTLEVVIPPASGGTFGSITGVVHGQAPPTPPMAVYALDTSTGAWVVVETQQADVAAPFSLEVPPGNYLVFAISTDGTLGHVGYSLNGVDLATITVAAGQTVTGIRVSPPTARECGVQFDYIPDSPDGRFPGIDTPCGG